MANNNGPSKSAFQQYGPRRGGGPGRLEGGERAHNARGALRRLAVYFGREKRLLTAMLAVVAFGTACGVWAPSLQS